MKEQNVMELEKPEVNPPKSPDTSIPPKTIKRNDFGLVEGFDYKYDPKTGLVDWRAMVPSEFLYVNPSRKEKVEKKYGKTYDEIKPIEDNVEDTDLVLMLGGVKQLLRIRGYNSVEFLIKESNMDYASVNCTITFIPNFETEGRTVIFSENACAHLGNTSGFGQKYLLELATNRAFCRAVRNFLNINIVSKEEISGGENGDPQPSKPAPKNKIAILENLMEKKKVKFDPHIIKKLKDENKFNEEWKSIEDLPLDVVFDLIERIKKYNP